VMPPALEPALGFSTECHATQAPTFLWARTWQSQGVRPWLS
jgi:hypothetical protein